VTEPGRTDTEIRPFRIDIPQTDLDDLHDRLASTRWPSTGAPPTTGGSGRPGSTSFLSSRRRSTGKTYTSCTSAPRSQTLWR
jgi:hypothetical protein